MASLAIALWSDSTKQNPGSPAAGLQRSAPQDANHLLRHLVMVHLKPKKDAHCVSQERERERPERGKKN